MKTIHIIILLATLSIFGCSVGKKVVETGNVNSKNKILITTENTEFKQEIVDRLIQKLSTHDCYFQIISHKELEKTDINQYKAILLICKVTAGKIQSKANIFFQKEKTNPKVLLLLTSGNNHLSETLRTDLNGVDAITSASKMNEVEQLTNQLKDLIIKKL